MLCVSDSFRRVDDASSCSVRSLNTTGGAHRASACLVMASVSAACAAPAPVLECIAPVLAKSATPAPAVHAAPAPMASYIAPVHAVTEAPVLRAEIWHQFSSVHNACAKAEASQRSNQRRCGVTPVSCCCEQFLLTAGEQQRYCLPCLWR